VLPEVTVELQVSVETVSPSAKARASSMNRIWQRFNREWAIPMFSSLTRFRCRFTPPLIMRPSHEACSLVLKEHDRRAGAEGDSRGMNAQTRRETGSQPSACGETKGLDLLTEPCGHAGPWLDERGKPFDKDLARTVDTITEKFAHIQDQLHRPPTTCQISRLSAVLTVDATSRMLTAWTSCLLSC
jgi:hypothetical protein